MIKLENYEVLGWEHAIRGMRNPLNSWEQSDSCWSYDMLTKKPDLVTVDDDLFLHVQNDGDGTFDIGPNDQKLMMNLRNAGTDHRKFMRMLTVYVDITAPLYWWKEFDTYKVGTVANSCSTMHKIHAKEFIADDFSFDIPGEYDEFFFTPVEVAELANRMVVTCEYLRKEYLWRIEESKNPNRTEHERLHYKRAAKKVWRLLIQYMSISYNQKRTVMLNYEVLANIYKSRRHHKLDEWHVLCDWIEKLPYAELITGETET